MAYSTHAYSAPPPYFPPQWYPAPSFHPAIAYHPGPHYYPPPQYYPPPHYAPPQHHPGPQHHLEPHYHHTPPYFNGPQYHPAQQFHAAAQEPLDRYTHPAQHTRRRILPARLPVDDAQAEEHLTYATPPTPGVVLGAVDEAGTEEQGVVRQDVAAEEQPTIKAEPNDAETNGDFLAIKQELMEYEGQSAQQTAKRSRAEDGEEMDQRPTKRSASGSGVLTSFAEPR